MDQLTDDELVSIDRILEGSGLLGDAAALSADRRLNKLRFECKGRFCEILLWLLNSPHIQTRLNEISSNSTRHPGFGNSSSER